MYTQFCVKRPYVYITVPFECTRPSVSVWRVSLSSLISYPGISSKEYRCEFHSETEVGGATPPDGNQWQPREPLGSPSGRTVGRRQQRD